MGVGATIVVTPGSRNTGAVESEGPCHGAMYSTNAAAAAKKGPLKDLYDRTVAGGVREEMAKLTLARKLAAVVLRLWKKGEPWDPTKLTMQAT